MDDEHLNAVFRFKHKAPSDRQDAALSWTLMERFDTFVNTLEATELGNLSCGRLDPLADDRVVPAAAFSRHELEVLKEEVCRCLAASPTESHRRGDVWYDPWLPMYGCAIQRTKLSSTRVKLEIGFVDGWERALHFLPTGECIHSSVPKTHRTLHGEELDTQLEEKFAKTFAFELQEAQKRSKSGRSAATNELGHQKTPQFIAAVVHRSVALVTGRGDESSFAPNGGTTDVGQHTGGRPRDTCWALVKAAIERNLCCGRGLFRKTLTLFKLSLIQSEIARAEDVFSTDSIDVKRGCDLVDDLFFMLQVVVQHVIELLGDGYDVASLQEQCADSRASIDGFVGALNLQTAKQYVLPEFTALQQLNGLSCGVEILSPKRDNESSSSESIEDCRRRALVNLKPCQFVGGASCSLDNLLLWVRSDNAAPQSYKRILTLRTIEAFLFARSPALVDGGNVQQAEDGDELFVANMQSLVTHYQKIADEWRQHPQRTSVLSAEQRSRQLLMWIAFCLVHQKCLHEFPLCSEYNIALEWKDLKVAVLSDRAAVEALQRVAQYVRGWNLKTGGARLFHLTDQEPTFSFAWKFAEGNPSMEERYNQEVEAWKAHVQSEWSEIEAKKERVDNLRADKTRLNEDLRSHHNDLALEEGRLLLAYPSSLPTEPSQVATAR